MAAISWQQRVTIPVAVSTVAILIATGPLAFPKPEFLPLVIYLLAVNVMAFSASWLPRGWWLRILAYTYTSAIFFMWSINLRSEILNSGKQAGSLRGLSTTYCRPSLQPAPISQHSSLYLHLVPERSSWAVVEPLWQLCSWVLPP